MKRSVEQSCKTQPLLASHEKLAIVAMRKAQKKAIKEDILYGLTPVTRPIRATASGRTRVKG